MGIQNDGFTKDPSTGSGGGFTAPTGTGFVKVTSGVLDTASSSLAASDVTAAVQDLQTTASPQLAGINLGHASDTTLARSAAGQITVEGVSVATASNTLTLTNKTLTAPKLADGGFIADANGNEGLILTTTASAVNEVTLANAATGNNPKLSATGGDTNIGIDLQTKGTGVVRLLGNSTQQAELRLFEDTDNGSNYVGIKPPASVTSNLVFQLPQATGAGKVMTDLAGDGVLTMETVSATYNAEVVICSKTSDQSLTNSTDNLVTWQQNDYQSTSGMHDTSTNTARLVAQSSGKFMLIFTLVGIVTGSAPSWTIKIRKNGTVVRSIIFNPTMSSYVQAVGHWLDNLTSGDYFEIAWNPSAGTNTAAGSSSTTGITSWASLHKIGA